MKFLYWFFANELLRDLQLLAMTNNATYTGIVKKLEEFRAAHAPTEVK